MVEGDRGGQPHDAGVKIGIQIRRNGPAQEAGIVVGDYITAVGDTDVKSLTTVETGRNRGR